MANGVPTLGDVANLAGVSKSTASRILAVSTGAAKKIPYATETQGKVLAAAAKLGYKPSKLARGLTLAKTGIVGLVVPSLTDSFFPFVTSAIETHLADAGYSVIVTNTNADSKVERARVEDLLSWQVDGLIIAPAQETGDAGLFWELWQRKIPFVLIDRTFRETPFYSVSTEDEVGAGLVVEHLIATGRRRIARVGGPLAVSTNRLRHAGYTAALIRHGILPQAEYALESPPTEEGGYRSLARIMHLEPRPDAVFCFSDNVAIGILEACSDRGIGVPGDLAVVGYADLPHLRLLKVSLTSVRQPRPLLGRHAAEMLLACMEEGGQPEPIQLPVELMIRESTVGKTPLALVEEEASHANRLRTTLLALGILGIPAMLPAAPTKKAADFHVAQPFELRQVRLLDGPFLKAMERNQQYLLSLDLDRQLHVFRVTAGLPSSAAPLGGWESPSHGGRGEFFGHSLSARAFLYAATGDARWKQQLDYLVAELGKCQRALGSSGYLHAEPESVFDRLEAGDKNVEGLYYTVHKLMAGLLDVYACCGNQQALEIAERMAGWVDARSGRLSSEHWQRILDVEFGGLNDALYRLYAITHNPRHLKVARRFDHEKIYRPLAEGHDELKGLHANTTIPKIIGAAQGYEVTGNPRFRKIAECFWRQVAEHRSYATGGTSNFEHWRTAPDELAGELSNETQECCCTYNMLKLTRHIFSWTGDPHVADFYERALFNGILGTLNPESGTTMYYVPLAGGYWKTFASPLDSFWCCTGTGVESFAKLADSIYFHDRESLWVNLFIASELNWPEKGLTLKQQTRFPEEQGTTLHFSVRQPVELTLRLRIPSWATRGVTMRLNSSPLDASAVPGSYAEIRRTWKNGDRLTMEMPMNLHLQPMPDDKNTAAILYGPIVLAGCLGDLSPQELRNYNPGPGGPPTAVPVLSVDRDDLAASIKPSGKPLEFRARTKETDITLMPFYSLFGKRYAVYWKIAPREKVDQEARKQVIP